MFKKIFFLLFSFCMSFQSSLSEPQPFLSRFNKAKYQKKFTAFSYVNPNAPKGGKLRMGTMGTFDSLNKDIVKGIPAESLLMTTDPLMKSTVDDPHSLYALVAESADLAPDSSAITFYIDKRAKFHDGTHITAEDIKFTIELLKEKGLPRYKEHFSKIDSITLLSSHALKITFKKGEDGYNPELPLIIARLRPLSKKDLEEKDFQSTGLTPILGNGPYRIGAVTPGRSITYERVKDYWAADLPVNKGQYNFDEIIIDYYKNAQAQFEAFKAGEFDCFFEADQKQWHTAYNFQAVKDGRIKQIQAEHKRPVSVRTFIFNLRRPIFQDIRVRKALTYAYDFETFNKMYFHGAYHRMNSLFANTHFVATEGATEKEMLYLSAFKEHLDPEVFSRPFLPPTTNGDGNQRENLRIADQLLNEAGWIVKEGKRVHKETGQLFAIEFMLKDFRQEKAALAYKKSLSQLGINLTVRVVDTTQYEKRAVERDFDIIAHTWTNSLSPGLEQRYYFSSQAAELPGSSNYIGVKDPMYEKLAQNVADAQTEEDLAAAVKALDRVVMNTYIMIPIFYDNGTYFSYWQDRLDCLPFDPAVGTNVLEWWWSKKIG